MKQSSLASFFGAKGKSPGGKAPAAGSGSQPKEAASPAGEQPAGRKLKRLRKVSAEAEQAAASAVEQAAADSQEPASPQPAKPAAAAAATEPMEAESPAPAAAAAVLSSPSATPGSQTPAKRRRAGGSPAGAPATSGSEREASASASPSPQPKRKKAAAKAAAPAVKVEGVGAASLAAAAAHADFDIDALAPWAPGAPTPFRFLAAAFEAIGADSKRLAKTQALVGCFRVILGRTPADLLPALYLCTNSVAPAHEATELGVGDAILIRALAAATGRQEARIKKEYSECGDLGTVASAARGVQRTMFAAKPLTLPGVFATFLEIARTEGQKSQERKKALITKLLVSASDNEPSFIMRALQGKLRIGLGAETVLVSLAHAVLLHRRGGGNADGGLAGRLEAASQAVKLAYSQCPSFDALVPALLQHPVEEINEHVRFVAGVPVKPMLAKPTTGVSEVLDKFAGSEFTCEYKYDGERAQIHITQGGKVAIYSRNSEDNTGKYPDLAAALPGLLQPGVKEVVLDAEAVAFDRETGKILPFQVLSTRARKDVKVADIKVRVCVFAFDCLFLDGATLLQRPLSERRRALEAALTEKPGELHLATAKTSTDVEELARFLDDAVAAGTEGLIVKSLSSTYEPSKRSAHWLKLKKDYMTGVGDTFDVVPIGAWHGRGKRTGVYGSYLLAVWNEASEEFETISKIGTGFSDEALTELSAALNQHVLPGPKPYYKYGETLVPDVWFDAAAVWEVKAADLSISPVHRAAAGLVDAAKGISIRFPRLVRVREDKGPEQATTAEQVAEMYRAQAVLAAKGRGAAADDE